MAVQAYNPLMEESKEARVKSYSRILELLQENGVDETLLVFYTDEPCVPDTQDIPGSNVLLPMQRAEEHDTEVEQAFVLPLIPVLTKTSGYPSPIIHHRALAEDVKKVLKKQTEPFAEHWIGQLKEDPDSSKNPVLKENPITKLTKIYNTRIDDIFDNAPDEPMDFADSKEMGIS